jgi:hypothetical protein
MAPADKALRSGELRNKMTALSALTTIYRVIDKFVLTFVPRESHRRPLPKKKRVASASAVLASFERTRGYFVQPVSSGQGFDRATGPRRALRMRAFFITAAVPVFYVSNGPPSM